MLFGQVRSSAADVPAAWEHLQMRDDRMKIRLMTDDISGVALWPDVNLDYPGSKVEYLFLSEGEPEDLLPIAPALRDRIRAWVDEYTASIGERAPLDLYDHDRRGYVLSQELQTELGPEFRIEYQFQTDELRREVKAARSER
jgi:hypothetical protein